ncbi:MAG TPA: hypothetical protein DEP05_05675 [Betaproteobacteria bacterium]|nr:hypothetical protein [Betaproteobacteria bacterium]
MEIYTKWFVLGLVLLGLELATGTFYMLVMAIALGAGGLAALAGLPAPAQLTVAAVVGVTGTLLLRSSRLAAKGKQAPAPGLDTGNRVTVLTWRDDGTARVYYRGAEWDAATESPATPRQETLYIREVRGSQLILTHHKP